MRASYEHLDTGERSFNAYVREDKAFEFNWHYHPEYELTLILGGFGQRMVGDSVEDYGPGDLVLLGSNLPHTWRSNASLAPGRHRAVVVQFPGKLFGDSLIGIPEMRGIAGLLQHSARGLCFEAAPDVKKIAGQLTVLPQQSPAKQLISLLDLLDQLSAQPAARVLCSGDFVKSLRGVDEARIDQICKQVAQSFSQPLRQEQMAKSVGMHPAAFCRFFKQVTGRTFMTYLNEVRISAACRLLIETSDSIAAISYDVGYSSQAHFTHQFRRFKNLSPGKFRKQFSGKPASGNRGEAS